MTNLKPFVLIHEHDQGRSVYGFFYQPTKAWPFPSARRVATKLGLKFKRRADERLSLHAVVNDPPDLVLSAATVGCRSAKLLHVKL